MELVTSDFDPKAFSRRSNACCNAHDVASLDAFVLPDIRVNGEFWGLARYQHGLEAVVMAFPDYQWHLDDLLADGDWLAARFTDRRTHLEGDGTLPNRCALDAHLGQLIQKQRLGEITRSPSSTAATSDAQKACISSRYILPLISMNAQNCSTDS